jgi:hypothetical protein
MRRRSILIAVPLLAVAAVAAVLLIGGGDDDKKASPAFAGGIVVEAENAYRLTYPKAWKQLGQARAAQTTIQKRDGSGLLVVRQRGKLEGGLGKTLERQLTTQLKRQYKDFKLVQSGEVSLPAGKGLSYTFVRSKANRVQGVVVIPKGERTFTFNSVVTGSAETTAREVARIIRTFDPEN